ncbi:hypothetical protein, partial [Enterobacter asburiae]
MTLLFIRASRESRRAFIFVWGIKHYCLFLVFFAGGRGHTPPKKITCDAPKRHPPPGFLLDSDHEYIRT